MKPSPVADDTIVYMKNPKDSTKKTPKPPGTSEVIKVTGSIHKSQLDFLQTSKEHVDTKNTVPFTVTQTRKKYCINLTKQDLSAEDYKTLAKEINKDLNNWEDLPRSWLGRLNIVKDVSSPQIEIHV